MKWFAVGEIDAETGYEAIQANTSDEAEQLFRESNDTPSDCEVSATFVKNWQGKDVIQAADWFNSDEGLSYSCTSCYEQVSQEFENGKVIDGEVWCDWCLEAGLKADAAGV